MPDGLPVTVLALAGAAIAVLSIALAATLIRARRRRAERRLLALVDPVTGLRSRVRLLRDLRVLSRDGDAGAHLLATLELTQLAAQELEHGIAAADELLHRLGSRLANAVGRAGGVYAWSAGALGCSRASVASPTR